MARRQRKASWFRDTTNAASLDAPRQRRQVQRELDLTNVAEEILAELRETNRLLRSVLSSSGYSSLPSPPPPASPPPPGT